MSDASHPPLLFQLLQHNLCTLDDDLVLHFVYPRLELLERPSLLNLDLPDDEWLSPVDLPDHSVNHDPGVADFAVVECVVCSADCVCAVESSGEGWMEVDNRDGELLVERDLSFGGEGRLRVLAASSGDPEALEGIGSV